MSALIAMRMLRVVCAVAFAAMLHIPAVEAWDVHCTVSQGGPECKDPFERVRSPWRDDDRAEHGALLR